MPISWQCRCKSRFTSLSMPCFPFSPTSCSRLPVLVLHTCLFSAHGSRSPCACSHSPHAPVPVLHAQVLRSHIKVQLRQCTSPDYRQYVLHHSMLWTFSHSHHLLLSTLPQAMVVSWPVPNYISSQPLPLVVAVHKLQPPFHSNVKVGTAPPRICILTNSDEYRWPSTTWIVVMEPSSRRRPGQGIPTTRCTAVW
jgi:hypothetical protein